MGKSKTLKRKWSKNMLLLKEKRRKIYHEYVKVVSFNIGMGAQRKSTNKDYLLSVKDSVPQLIAFIKKSLLASTREKAIICLQEVDFNMQRSGKVNFLKKLQSALGKNWNYYYFDPTNPKKQKYGIGIITNLEGTRKDGKPKEQKWKVYDTDSLEDRGAIAIKLKMNKHMLWVVNTHIGFSNPASQFQRILKRIQTFDPQVPVILCGDFNVADLDYTYGNRSKNHALYHQTIKQLELNGFFKSEIVKGAPFTFHSWNSKKNASIADYIMCSYPYSREMIVNLLTLQDFKTVTPSFKKKGQTWYASDHNAVVTNYLFP